MPDGLRVDGIYKLKGYCACGVTQAIFPTKNKMQKNIELFLIIIIIIN